jgi:hypothetical protein
MSESAEDKTYRKYSAYAWALLAVLLFVGLFMHKSNDWNLYTALWLTEAFTFSALALNIYYWGNKFTAFAALLAAFSWFINQGLTWYGYGNVYSPEWSMYGGSLIYWITASISGGAVIYGFAFARQQSRKYLAPGDSIVASLVEGHEETVGKGAFLVMIAFAGWKLYEVQRQFTLSATFTSAALWGLGILVMSFGSVTYLHYKRRELVYLCYAGLFIAAVAALAFGLALSMLRYA